MPCCSEIHFLQFHALCISLEDGVIEHLHDFLSGAVEVDQ